MDLPSFLWLWRIAAWSMGSLLLIYTGLAASGITVRILRQRSQPYPVWLRPLHLLLGGVALGLVLLLMTIGIVGTLGYYGNLGHSGHLPAGLIVVALFLISAWSASRMSTERPWARSLHVKINLTLLFALGGVLLTGWDVVQKYLP